MMGKMKNLALLADEYREEAVHDLESASLITDAVGSLGDLDPGDHEKNALLLALHRSADALHARATTRLSASRYWLSLAERLDGDAGSLKELKDALNEIDEHRRSGGDA
jgi:hypothetical protein